MEIQGFKVIQIMTNYHHEPETPHFLVIDRNYCGLVAAGESVVQNRLCHRDPYGLSTPAHGEKEKYLVGFNRFSDSFLWEFFLSHIDEKVRDET